MIFFMGHIILLVYQLHLVLCGVMVTKIDYSNATMVINQKSIVQYMLKLSVKLAMKVRVYTQYYSYYSFKYLGVYSCPWSATEYYDVQCFFVLHLALLVSSTGIWTSYLQLHSQLLNGYSLCCIYHGQIECNSF